MRGRVLLLVLLTVLLPSCGQERDLPVPPDLVAVAEDLDRYWQAELPQAVQDPPEVLLVAGDVDTECGEAVEDEGSFYCGADATVYLQQLDLDELEQPAARVYLLAHEYAHAVQDLLDVDEGDAGKGPDGASVRYELQADCLAGAYVAVRDDAADPAYLRVVRAGGDDVGEDPLPEAQYEHGTGEQRVAAFRRGLTGGSQACDLAA